MYFKSISLFFIIGAFSVSIFADESRQMCLQASDREIRDAIDAVPSMTPAAIRGKKHYLLYDSEGRPCNSSNNRITEGDKVFIGYYGYEGNEPDLRVLNKICNLQNPGGRLRSEFLDLSKGANIKETKPEIARPEPSLIMLSVAECFGTESKFQLVKRDDTNVVLDDISLQQYQRFYATIQVGALWTELQDRSYSTVDRDGSGAVITSNIDDSRGPLYVGTVTIYGIPHHVKSLFSKEDDNYPGRDIVNHNNLIDRVGLTLSFGLDEPKDTFGVGLSFEIATGLSLTYTQLYRRIDVLDGVNEGDAFTGSSVPTKESWEDEGVWGITIDGRLITKFFGVGS